MLTTNDEIGASKVYRARAYLLRTLDPLSRDYIVTVWDWRSRLAACDLLLDVLRSFD